MITPNAPAPAALVTRVIPPDPTPSHVNPLLRLHLMLYGRYKWAILLGLLLGAVGAVAVWFQMPPKYEVVGFIRVKPYIPPVLSTTDQNGVLPMFETYVSLQVSLLQSQRVLDQASMNPEWKALGRNSVRWGTKIPADDVKVDHPKTSELVTVGFTDQDSHVAAIAVKSILQAYQATSGDTDGTNNAQRLQVLEELRTSLTNQKRALGDQILALANEFGSDELQNRYQFKLEEQNKLESELQQVRLDISVAQAAAGGGGSEAPTTQLAATAPTGGGGGGAVLEPSAQPVTAANASPPTTVPMTQPALKLITREEVGRIDYQMRDLLMEESRYSMRLNQLRLRLGNNHPEVVAAQSDLQGVEDQINSLLATYQERASTVGSPIPVAGVGAVSSPRTSLLELRAREANILALFEKVQTETKTLGQQDLKIRKLKGDQDAITKKLDETAARIDQLNLESTMSNRISILSYGETPTAPLSNKRIPLTIAVGLLGLAAGAALTSLRGLADRRMSSLLHMQQLAPALRVLGMLPVLPEDLADPAQISLAAHCVHQIRSLLESVPTNDKGRALAVTSPSAGDGKTSLTLALGLSFAASGSRTLLIDCDLIGGGLTRRLNAITHRRIGSILQRQGLLTDKQIKEALRVAADTRKKFGETLVALGFLQAPDIQRALADQQETSLGLIDALHGEPLAACVTSVVREGLFILPVGAATADHASQLSSKVLRRVIQEARSQFDFIIIDTGPILGSVEATVAARETDEVVLAIARGAPAPLVTRTVELLGALGAHLGGVVFNRATPGDVSHSNYGSSGSLRSFRSVEVARRSQIEPRRPFGSPPRLGPVASAVAANGNGSSTESAPPTNGTARKHSAGQNGNGTATPSEATSAGAAGPQESANP
jgi:Mrp family chromosome partitioning ATPase/uncharacterized protein involved in exopolysaccharide biosynthesis